MASERRAVRVKVCGIANPEDAQAAVEAGAHALGFVFYSASPRYVAPERAASIISELPPFVTTVGVFVNRSRGEVERVAEQARLYAVQLHGDESPRDCIGYRIPVIKAFRPSPIDRFPDLALYPVSAVLMDAHVPGTWGGSGKTLDWHSLARHLESVSPTVRARLILAGGLTARNVAEAVRIVRPFAVDICSGVEVSPGKKSHTLMKELIHALHYASSARSAA
jgi:phosphoribosylanthranilate isomerase